MSDPSISISTPRSEHRQAGETNLVTLASILPFLYRNAGTIVAATAIALLTGIVYLAMTPRAYVASAELLIQQNREPPFWAGQGAINPGIDNAQVESEIEILRSERIAGAVIDELHLADDPEFVPAGGIPDIEKSRAAIQSFMNRSGAVRVGQSYMVTVSFRSSDPDKAARITNALTRAYESFLEGLTRNEQQASFPTWTARIISPALPPLRKSYPKTELVLALSLLVGALTGLVLALLRQALDHSVRTPADIRRVLGIECFGVLPEDPGNGNGGRRYKRVFDAPLSPFADALRGVKLTINPAGDPGRTSVLGVTSLGAGEGKSTVAVGLAAILAIAGRRTLLIDGNLRHPSISQALAPKGEKGLLDLLKQPIDAVQEISVLPAKGGLALIPAGVGERLANSSDALGSARMEMLLCRLRRSFEVIVIDLPALATVVDARASARFLDGCVLVTEWGRTPLDALQDPVALLRACRVPVLGAVINKSAEGTPDFASVFVPIARWVRSQLGLSSAFRPPEAGVQYPFDKEPANGPLQAPVAGND